MIIQRDGLDALFQDANLTPALADALAPQDVLMLAFQHVRATFMHELFDTKALYYPQLDAILARLSERMYADTPGWAPGSGLQLIIGSHFSAVGGHSRVAKNFAALAPRNVVVVTDPFDQQTPDERREMLDFFAPLPVVFIPAGDLAFKVDYLRALIVQARPDFTVCFNHHVDPVPVAATAAAPVPRRMYYHHCDYRPALGASLAAFAHVDINEEMGRLCGSRCGTGHVHVLDLHDAQVAEPARLPHHVPDRPLNTVSAGSSGKYQFAAAPAPLSYPHVVAALLGAGTGVHHHFGNLAPEQLDLVRAVLAGAGVDPARFVYHGNVASVQQAVAAIENAVYMPSFPVGGALTIVEVLSAGIPVLLNANTRPTDAYDFLNASHVSLMPERYLSFTGLDEIAPALQAIAAGYEDFARASKARFETRHSRASFLAGLERLAA
jgi:hypothetical protein